MTHLPGSGQAPTPPSLPGGHFQAPHIPPPPPYPLSLQPPMPRLDEPQRRNRGPFVIAFVVTLIVLAMAMVSIEEPLAFMDDELGFVEGAAITPDDALLKKPTNDAPDEDKTAWASQTISQIMTAHADSLLENSQRGWLLPFPENLHDVMSMRYDNLVAMEVSRFDYQVDPVRLQDAGSGDQFEATVIATHCFSRPVEDCDPISVTYDTVWSDMGDELGLVSFEIPDNSADRPHAWESDPLVTIGGARTMVIAPQSQEANLTSYLSMAEEAAALADPWALWDTPDRYLVLFAPAEEFSTWHGGLPGDTEDIQGYAYLLTGFDDEEYRPTASITVMAVDNHRDTTSMRSTVRHELAHAATRWGADERFFQDDAWWLLEGIAEYVDHSDSPLDAYPRLSGMPESIQAGLCDTSIEPANDDDDAVSGNAKYGCAMLGDHYLIEIYGVDAFTELFAIGGRDGDRITPEIDNVLDISHAELMSDIGKFIRDTVG